MICRIFRIHVHSLNFSFYKPLVVFKEAAAVIYAFNKQCHEFINDICLV